MVLVIAALVIFVLGLIIGVLLIRHGFLLGWKSSYEIREGKSGETEGQGLFPSKKDPAEFELLDEEKKE